MRMKRRVVALILLVFLLAILAPAVSAASEAIPSNGLEPSILVGLAIMLVVAKLGGELFERWGQPAVLGELVGGILIGNLAILGVSLDAIKTSEVIAALAELGVIILLFEVG